MAADSGHERPQGVPLRPAQPPDRGEAYEVREEIPPRDASAGPTGLPVWHLAVPGGPAEGPMTLEALRQRMIAARLGPQTLIWRPGMPAWLPAREVSELRTAPAARRCRPPWPCRRPTARARFWRCRPSWRSCFRTRGCSASSGRACGIFGVILLPISLVLLAATSGWAGPTFTDALVLFLAFFAGEAASTVLEKLASKDKDARWSQGDPAEPLR